MMIMQVLSVRLSLAAREFLNKNEYVEAQNWLGQWTCANAVKALIFDAPGYPTRQEAHTMLAAEVAELIRQQGFDLAAFRISIGEAPVEDGRFWSLLSVEHCQLILVDSPLRKV